MNVNAFQQNSFLKAMFVLLSAMFCLFHQGLMAQAVVPDSAYAKGQFYAQNGAYDLALEQYFEALDGFATSGNDQRVGNTNNAIGLVYYQVGNQQEARRYFGTALALAKVQGDTIAMAYAFNNLGMVAQNERRSDSASHYYDKALALKLAIQDSMGISVTLTNLGTVEIGQGDFRAALQFYFESLDYKIAVNDSQGLATLYCNIGDAYGNLGVFDSTRIYLNKGYEIALALKRLPTLVQYYHNLSALYSVTDSLDLALDYLRRAMSAQDSLFSESLSEELARQEIQHQVAVTEKELRISKAELEVGRKTTQFMWLVVGALLVTVILLYFVVKFRTRTMRQQRETHARETELAALNLKREQEQKDQLLQEKEQVERELLSISMQTLEKKELLSNLYQSISNDREKGKFDDTRILNATVRALQQNLDLDDDWDNFKLHFEKVHPSFFSTLSDSHPKLTKSDHRHMAYMRIGLSTKEIARMFNITPDSVQKSRVRLKKKLDLGREDDLLDFVQKI